MNTQEAVYLFNEKKREGMNDLEASNEVKLFKVSQLKFKNLEKQLKNKELIIKRLEDKLEKIELEKKKEKSKKLIQGLKEVKQCESSKREGNINHLNRILRYLESESNPVLFEDILNNCIITRDQLKSSLIFLLKNKLVTQRGNRYSK